MSRGWLAEVLAVGLLAGCSSRDVVVAAVALGAEPSDAAPPDAAPPDARPADARPAEVGPTDEGAADAPPKGAACASNDQCAPDQFCATNACDAGTGSCEVRPVLCESTTDPVCGCDGVSFWNDCLRQRDGVASSSQGACTIGAALCTDPAGATCPVADASCARLVYGQYGQQPCPTSFPGVCWALPATCPSSSPTDPMWFACGAPRDCVDICTAIGAGGVYQLAFGPGTCP